MKFEIMVRGTCYTPIATYKKPIQYSLNNKTDVDKKLKLSIYRLWVLRHTGIHGKNKADKTAKTVRVQNSNIQSSLYRFEIPYIFLYTNSISWFFK